MRRALISSVIGALVCAVAWTSCMDRNPAPVCPVPTMLAQNEFMPGGFEGVDVLMVVDNSGTMASEQEILASSVFQLVNSLVNPMPDWEFAAADNVRFAVVSSDMGLQAGGQPYDPDIPWPGMGVCNSDGDDGYFKSYDEGKTVALEDGAIPCAAGGGQCPADWVCSAEEGDGVCMAPGEEVDIHCPLIGAPWAFTLEEDPNEQLPLQVSCLSSLGTSGCGFEQQLEAAAQGLTKPAQESFIREEALLAVIVVSDEEDCSIEDGQGLATAPEMGGDTVNIACGSNEQFLYSPEHYHEVYSEVKGGDDAVVFAAITGVPAVPECQGLGSEIGGCLYHPDMAKEVLFDEEKEYYTYRPACVSGSTEASPGRRYVELAREFEDMGYVYSICNDDWSPAMSKIAKLIASKVGGTCYDRPLDWDPEIEQARCDVVVELLDEEECPEGFEAEAGSFEEFTDDDGDERTRIVCVLPRLSAPKDCEELESKPQETGWYYCENSVEAVAASPELCRYEVQLTEPTKKMIRGSAVSIQCMQRFSFEDENCREDSAAICADGTDNDGNGVYDCDRGSADDGFHLAEPACCPMTVGEDGACVIEDEAFEICPGSSRSHPADACAAAADLLGCTLH